MLKPETSEYNPYYEKYISLIEEGELLNALERQPSELRSLLNRNGKRVNPAAVSAAKTAAR